MRDYAWIIDTDHQAVFTAPGGTNANAVGIVGPSHAPAGLVADLDHNKGERFRIYDGDQEVYYSGRIIGDYDGFEPLDDFATPNAGATDIKYRSKTGRWEVI